MKKLILSLTSALFTCVATAQSCVIVQQVSTNYANKQITFDVKWGTCNNTNHLYRVWVFVDYRPVTITTKGAWGRATIAATDKGTLVSANKGVWITGTANSTQRVTLTLDVIGNKFDWCAFAIDYPPNATMNNGVYTLKGTPPFTVNGAKLGDTQKTYTGSCISSITDATSNPDGFAVTPPPTISGGASTVAVGSNITWTGSPAGGTWSTQNSAIATVSNGVITGKAVGSTNITYAVTQGGCSGSTARAVEVKTTGGGGSGNGGTITGCSTVNLSFTSGFTSTQTWTVGNQTWSAPVTATYCNKTSFNGGNTGAFNSDCRTNSTAGYGHLFSWCMVAKFASSICPSGWRVPTSADFCTLDKALNGRSDCSNRNDATSRNRYLSTSWGGQYGGYAYSGSLYNQGSYAYYWSQSENSSAGGYRLYFYTNGGVLPQNVTIKDYGFTLRCVR